MNFCLEWSWVRGYDLLGSDPKILPAVKGKIGKLPMAKGQVSAEYNFSVVHSVDEFQQALGIDASVSVGLGVAGGSAKAKFEEKCKVTSEATFCVVSFKALNAPMSLRGDIELEDEAMELLQLKDERRFRERYGTHFCSDLYTGVEFIGSIQIVSSSQEREVEVAASINARYGPAKGSVKTECVQLQLVFRLQPRNFYVSERWNHATRQHPGGALRNRQKSGQAGRERPGDADPGGSWFLRRTRAAMGRRVCARATACARKRCGG